MLIACDRFHRKLRLGDRAFAIIFVLCLPVWPASAKCPGKLGAYNGYTIVDVQLRDPVGFIVPWNPLDNSLRKGLKLQKGQAFSNERFEQDSQKLGDALKARFKF